jgi:hypothetical protein
MPVVNGEKIEHVIFDCSERVLLHEGVYLQLIPVTTSNWQALKDTVCPNQNLHKPKTELEEGGYEDCIGLFCVKENGTFIPDGCIWVIDGGIFYIIKGLNRTALSFVAMDAEGRIVVVR